MQLIQKPIQSAQQAQAAQVTNFTSGFALILLRTNSRLIYQTPNHREEIGRKAEIFISQKQ
jgi:hypothetical protein